MTQLSDEVVERLAEHLCARRPCGDTPENVADWLSYSLDRCGLAVVDASDLAELKAFAKGRGDQ